ncbi:hypothetical protein F4810DRAFT_726342 [Camillea tinctor]|nr:hypothetical protein F4810DRAFT_726342 [Camillea tinctor]
MAPRKIVLLPNLMYTGYHGGLRWQTFGSLEWENNEIGYHKYAFLLHHNHAFHISKCIIKGLGTTNKTKISQAFADIYNLATDNVGLCKDIPPRDFFSRAKDSWEWSAKISDEAFWAFTYKAFHARAIFCKHDTLKAVEKCKEGSEEKEVSIGQPLTRALDEFRAAFDSMYIENYIPEPKRNPHPEEIDEENGKISMFKATREAYFPYDLTNADGEGDGFDKQIKTRVVKEIVHDGPEQEDHKTKARTRAACQEKDTMSMDLDANEEGNIGFYFDLGSEKMDCSGNTKTHNDEYMGEGEFKNKYKEDNVDDNMMVDGDDDDDDDGDDGDDGDDETDDGDNIRMTDIVEAEANKVAETMAALRVLAL